MAEEVRLRAGTTSEHSAFTGAVSELTHNTDTKRPHIHDGATAGGEPLALLGDIRDLKGLADTATGTNTLAIAPGLAPFSAYADKQMFVFEAANNNTGAVTLNVDSQGAKSVKKNGGADELEADDLVAGGVYVVIYDGTQFQLINSVGGKERPPILLSSTVFSSAQSVIDLTTGFDDTDYDAIDIEFADLDMDATAQLYGRVRSGGSFQAGSTDYRWGKIRKEVATSFTSNEGSSGDSEAELTASSTTGATVALDGRIRVFRPHGSTYFRNFVWDITSWNATSPRREWGLGMFRNADSVAAVDGFRLLASTGDISNGRVSVKGVRFT